MKKIISLLLALVIFTSFQVITNASNTSVKGYIQIEGKQIDSYGNITPRPKGYYTGIVAEGELKEQYSDSFNIAIGNGNTEDNILSYLTSITDDEVVFKNVIKDYYNKGYIKWSSTGEVIPWVKMTAENYYIEWYVLKHEQDGWHIDGRIIDLKTNDNIEIITPENPADIPPEAYDDIEDIVDTPIIPSKPEVPPYNNPYNLKNNYAYIFGRNDNIMEPEDSMKRGEAAAVIYRLLKQNNMLGGFTYDINNTPIFWDTAERWDRSSLEYMNYIGVYPNPDGTGINPTGDIKRNEAFKLMSIALGFTSNTSLTDTEYALILNNEGYIEGDENGDFMLDKVITRAEFCKIYNKIIGRDEMLLETADGIEITPETYGFIDIDDSAWYYEDVLKATSAYDENGYVNIETRKLNTRNNLDDFNN